MLFMKVLGEVSFVIDGVAIKPLRSRTATAILVYLACHQRPFSRDFLAEFFWEDRDPNQASANLRTALKLLRRPFGDNLTITRQTVAFNHESEHEIDVLTFAKKLNDLLAQGQSTLTEETAVQLSTVLDQNKSDFLHGFYLPHAPGFEQWQSIEQAKYRRLMERGLGQLVDFYLSYGRFHPGIDTASRLLTLNPLNETGNRQMMELLWRSGKRSSALRQFEEMRTLLAKELDITPTAETISLYNRIRTAHQPHNNLPSQTSPFIGREQDLAALQKNLAAPECRLVTVLGPGGVGKTRLLLACGQKMIDALPGQFVNGVSFVALSHLNNAQFLDTAIAEAVGVSLSGMDTPLMDLLNHLREKEMLLLLDNIEHLLEGEENLNICLEIITQILQGAPHVKLVISSRVRLQLQEELTFDLRGLPVPPPGWGKDAHLAEETAVSFPSMHLFLQRAKTVRRSFTPTSSHLQVIARICHLLDGLPLAIEMAASWMRHLSCSQILQQIEADLDFLQLSARNIPARHRTLRAVFDTSWKLLTEQETAVVRKLSIFRGPFTMQAARAVVGEDAFLLSSLVDKSFLQVNEHTSHFIYDMHQMLRQYAAERLAELPQDFNLAAIAHAEFHADFIQQRISAIKGGGPKQVFDEIAELIDEFRAAWDWCLTENHLEHIEKSLEGVFYFYWVKGWLNEGSAWAQRVAKIPPEASSDSDLLQVRGKMWQAEFYAWLGCYDEAGELFKQVIDQSHSPDAMPELVFALNGLGRVQYWQGMYEEAESTFELCLAKARILEDGYDISLALNCLANTIAEARKNYKQTWTLLEESLAVSQQMEDKYGSARALINLGRVARKQGNEILAKQLLTESLNLYRGIGYQHGIAAALKYLGEMAYHNGEYKQAQELIEQSYQMHWESGDRRGMVEALQQLGNLARITGKHAEAQQQYQEAIQVAQALNAEQLMLEIVKETAVLRQNNESKQAAILLHFVTHHPAAGKELADEANAIANKLLSKQPPGDKAIIVENATRLSMDSAIKLAMGLELVGRELFSNDTVN